MHVYVVTRNDGCYECGGETEILGIYDDLEIAERAEQCFHDAEIKEVELGEAATQLEMGLLPWSITFDRSGQMIAVKRSYGWPEGPYYSNADFTVYVWAKDKEDAERQGPDSFERYSKQWQPFDAEQEVRDAALRAYYRKMSDFLDSITRPDGVLARALVPPETPELKLMGGIEAHLDEVSDLPDLEVPDAD